ncbi:hypothetical protein JJC00_22515 [Bradyrhizobium diazoefficiens]|uniref:hypothetical protein n=1 Tax=Bradyrhizobium diazoefficiens TaxID=1355477 RepID=UPI00190AFE58|nr:hypothetical protein [Bradyrhizobium diazoefficiens]QQO31411.1 hypothetical protein JJC00_22515 [Bradyrhizobium diazoefficiens]
MAITLRPRPGDFKARALIAAKADIGARQVGRGICDHPALANHLVHLVEQFP